MENPGKRTLTDADVNAIAEAIATRHPCQFTSEEVVMVRRWLGKIDRIATAVGYAVIGAIVSAVMLALWVGIKSIVTRGPQG